MLESLRNEWLFASDLASRRLIAAQMQEQVFIDVPFIPLGQMLPSMVYRRSLIGVLNGYPLFWNVRKV
jgi:peptide/nickel transport system substrate-binding protein